MTHEILQRCFQAAAFKLDRRVEWRVKVQHISCSQGTVENSASRSIALRPRRSAAAAIAPASGASRRAVHESLGGGWAGVFVPFPTFSNASNGLAFYPLLASSLPPRPASRSVGRARGPMIAALSGARPAAGPSDRGRRRRRAAAAPRRCGRPSFRRCERLRCFCRASCVSRLERCVFGRCAGRSVVFALGPRGSQLAA